MQFKLTAFMESNGGHGYIAWIDNPKRLKMLVHGDTQEQTAKNLIVSLKVSLSYQLGIDVTAINNTELSDTEHYLEWSKELATNGKKEFKFQLA